MILTPADLETYLDARKGATFISIYAVTEPKMRKTGNPYFGNVVHVWGRNVRFGTNYENAVNKCWGEYTADYFSAAELWKGKGVRINRYMAEHQEKNQKYLVYILQIDADGKPSKPLFDEYRNATTGELISKEELLPFLPQPAPSKKQRILELGCKETFPRTVAIDGGTLGIFSLGVYQINIDTESIALDGMTYPAVP